MQKMEKDWAAQDSQEVGYFIDHSGHATQNESTVTRIIPKIINPKFNWPHLMRGYFEIYHGRGICSYVHVF